MSRTVNPLIHHLLSERWSPRSFDGTPLSEHDLLVILEAAGLAPSAFNLQPWTFLYSRHGDEHWDLFLSLLIPFNAAWAKNAGALIFIVSQARQDPDDASSISHSHSFDAGAAWAFLALQATAMGMHAHGMTGIDMDRATSELGIPTGFRLEAAVAIGRRASPEQLPQKLRDKEKRSDRKPLYEIARHGRFA